MEISTTSHSESSPLERDDEGSLLICPLAFANRVSGLSARETLDSHLHFLFSFSFSFFHFIFRKLQKTSPNYTILRSCPPIFILIKNTPPNL